MRRNAFFPLFLSRGETFFVEKENKKRTESTVRFIVKKLLDLVLFG